MLVTALIVCGVGAIFLILGIIFKLAGSSSKNRMMTQGLVVDMCVNASAFNNGGNPNLRAVVTVGSTSTSTRCPIYQYVVNGCRYTRASSVAYNVAKVNKMIGQYVNVYYDPYNPQKSSLSKRGTLGTLGIVFISVGAGLLILAAIIFVVSVMM